MSDKNISSAENDISVVGVTSGKPVIPKGLQKDVKKRWMMVGAVAVGVIAVSSTMLSSGKTKAPVRQTATASAVDTTPKGLKEERDWKDQVGADVLLLKKENSKMTTVLNDLVKATREIRSDLAEVRKNQTMMPDGSMISSPPTSSNTTDRKRPPSSILLPEPPKVPSSLTNSMVNPVENEKPKTPVGLTPPPLSGNLPGTSENTGIHIPAPPQNTGGSGSNVSTPPPSVVPVIPEVKRSPAVSFIPASSVLDEEKAKEATFKDYERNANAGYLPAGSFAQATMISGVEAFTGGTSQSQPQPVVVRIDENAILPNAAKYQIRGCHVLASVWGDMSSERVYGRLATLTCVDSKDKLVLSQEIEGVLIDSDGKNGIRGHLIDRQGAKLARSLLAGLAEGMSDALGAAQSTSFASGSGVTTAFTGSHLASAGYGGASRAAEQLSEFYLKQAEATMPVIAVDAGRRISVLVTKSQSLTFKSVDNYTPVEKDKIVIAN